MASSQNTSAARDKECDPASFDSVPSDVGLLAPTFEKINLLCSVTGGL